MRKLASIQKIISLKKIDNSDFLEVAKILGWNVVVRVGDFKAGDLCVYCEIDSVLPEKEEFEFLKERKYRIKTIKLRGVISQGIAFPISIVVNDDNIPNVYEGVDVTDAIGVKKYELPELFSNIKSEFPSFIPKSDQTRIQSIPDFLERYRNRRFYITEKLEGTSATYFIVDDTFGICSRGRELYDAKDDLYSNVARKFEIEKKLRRSPRNVAIQGEIVGHKVCGNNYGFNNVKGNQKFYLFNVFNIDSYRYLDFEDTKEFVNKYGFEMVPILDENFILNHTVEELVELSHGISLISQNIKKPKMREGIVVRSVIEDMDENFGSLSFKVVSPKFLLKRGKKRGKEEIKNE